MMVGVWSGTATLGKSLAVPQHFKQRFTIWIRNPLPDIFPKVLKTCPHKNLYMDTPSSITHKKQMWKQTKCTLTNEHTQVHIYIHTYIIYIYMLYTHKWVS